MEILAAIGLMVVGVVLLTWRSYAMAPVPIRQRIFRRRGKGQ